MRDRIYAIVQRAENGDGISKFYDVFIMVVALISLIPIMYYPDLNNPDMLLQQVMEKVDIITVYILFFDYILRWMVYDKISKKKSPWAFVIYPFTFFALVDFASLLPSLGLVAASQAFRVLRVLRVFKVMHYSKSFVYVTRVFKREKEMLLSVLLISVAYIFISALVIFAIEPHNSDQCTFNSFFDALYWATTALTTVGYGDIYPVTTQGHLISMVSSLFGIAVIALPAGIITSGFMDELSKDKERKRKREEKLREALKEEIREEIIQELDEEERPNKKDVHPAKETAV